jgi:hypothetical protein
MADKGTAEQYSDAETAQRLERALRRSLVISSKPRKPKNRTKTTVAKIKKRPPDAKS